MTPLRRRLLALGAGTVVALGAAEALLRVTGFGWYEPRIDSYGFVKLDEDPARLHWGFDPKITSWHQWDGDPYGALPPGARIDYDDVQPDGLRGPPLVPDGRPRVLFVGDSFTFGEGVRAEQTFVAGAQRALALGGRNAVAVNAGVPGYGTFEESLLLPALVGHVQPQAVVVVFVPNDPIHVSESKEQEGDLLRGGGRAGAPRLYELARLALGARARTRAVEDWYLDHYVGARADAWRRSAGELVAMRDVARARGAAFGVAYFPLLHDLAGSRLARIEELVAGACAQADIPFVDLTPQLRGTPERQLWLHPVDHHPNARAHALVAPELARFARTLLDSR